MSEDMCPEIGMAVQNHFAAINVRTGRARHSKHRQSLVTLSRRYPPLASLFTRLLIFYIENIIIHFFISRATNN
jgi:hypothetical protein